MIYEYRVYHIAPGKMPDINARFTNHTMNLFEKHGIRVVGFWQTAIGDSDELTYLCQFDDLAHRTRAWEAFAADPDWSMARAESEKDGPLVAKVTNTILTPTPYSPLK